jgi:hypothetical protein
MESKRKAVAMALSIAAVIIVLAIFAVAKILFMSGASR